MNEHVFMLGLGDSLVGGEAGLTATPWVQLLHTARVGGNFSINNAGVGGHRTDQTLTEFRNKHKGRGCYTDAGILVGTNDAAQRIHTAAVAASNIITLCTELLAEGVKPYVLEPLPRAGGLEDSAALQTYLDDLRAALAVGLPAGATYVTTWATMGNAPTNARQLKPSYAAADGLHLNQAGHTALAALFLPYFPIS